MLISKIVKVKSSKYYKNLGYNIDDRYIDIKIDDLVKGSRVIVEASCDYCDNVKEITYKEYNKNISKNGKYSCSIKCGTLKAKESNLEKYGVDSVFKLGSVKDKIKESILEKYGVEHISKSKEISDKKSVKMKQQSSEVSKRVKEYMSNLSETEKNDINKKRFDTNLSKYGKGYISQLDHIKDKIKDTVFNKWGGYTFQSSYLMDSVKKTNVERYGFEYSSKNEDIKNKSYLTNIERYGFKSPSMNEDIKNKMKDTTLSRYNVVNIMYSEEFRKKFNISNELNHIGYLGNRNYEFLCDDCGSRYDIDYDNYYKRKLRNVSTCTICFPIMENSSIKEVELRNYISSIYEGEIISSYRDGLEIDIYLPELGLGFEFNGIYWHSDEKLDKNYHINKLNHFKEKGIRIINVWEDDWNFKKDIVKSQIDNLVLKSKYKIYARKCEIKIINDSKLVRKFMDDNHIQGYIRSTIKIGLFYNGELLSIMTFDNSEGRKKMDDSEFNLSRFCSKLGYNVIGAASRLLNYFIKNYKPNRIISFADLDWSTGDLYLKLNFNLIKKLKPDFKYIVDNKRVNKQRFTKSKLVKLGYDINQTADKIIEKMSISKIYSCGQLKFELLLNNVI